MLLFTKLVQNGLKKKKLGPTGPTYFESIYVSIKLAVYGQVNKIRVKTPKKEEVPVKY
jgi:hypothetical protein